jgi:hypothetical protein
MFVSLLADNSLSQSQIQTSAKLRFLSDNSGHGEAVSFAGDGASSMNAL